MATAAFQISSRQRHDHKCFSPVRLAHCGQCDLAFSLVLYPPPIPFFPPIALSVFDLEREGPTKPSSGGGPGMGLMRPRSSQTREEERLRGGSGGGDALA